MHLKVGKTENKLPYLDDGKWIEVLPFSSIDYHKNSIYIEFQIGTSDSTNE